jgi:uncharacterized protein (DUF1499 family)
MTRPADLLRALLGRGPEGMAVPAPVDFATLVLPRSPNACLLAPPGDRRARLTAGPWPVPPERLFALLREVAAAEPRCWPLAAWDARRQAQWVVRSRLANFPDVVAAEAVPAPGGSALFLCSRALLGWSDFGVNAQRVRRWLAELERRVAAG